MGYTEVVLRQVGIAVIGRNEGERLQRCLESLVDIPSRVYVDSASTDGSAAMARTAGVDTVELSVSSRLTAARGRNAGLTWLRTQYPEVLYVQFVDGDCEMQTGWISAGVAAMEADPSLAIVFGRCRERYPERSVYNALCDDEWNTPVGEAATCGGNTLCRIDALTMVQGFDEDMIAGEEPDLATRLRALGWRLRRLGDEMVLHDADILHFSQWWKRMQRSGHAVAELANRYPSSRVPAWQRRCRSIVFWSVGLPLAVIILMFVTALVDQRFMVVPAGLLLALPLQMARLALRRRRDLPTRLAIAHGIFTVIGKFAELIGLIRYHVNKHMGSKAKLIEYKTPD